MRILARFRRHPIALALAVASGVALVVFGPAPAAARSPSARPADAPAAWEWPVPPPRPLLRPFEAPPTPYAAGHRGIDVAAHPGIPVVAAADGVVSFVGVVVDRPLLSIRHADGFVSSIEPIAADVASGDTVRSGQSVGVVATGGHCDNRCVHFGVRLHGEYVNPLALLSTIERAILLPLGR